MCSELCITLSAMSGFTVAMDGSESAIATVDVQSGFGGSTNGGLEDGNGEGTGCTASRLSTVTGNCIAITLVTGNSSATSGLLGNKDGSRSVTVSMVGSNGVGVGISGVGASTSGVDIGCTV